MKRVLFAAFCIIALCSLLVINTGTVKAPESGYVRVDWMPHITPTIDGQWTSDDEWALNGEPTTIGAEVTFRSVWITITDVNDVFLVEFFNDTTDDAGDYWQLCINGDKSQDATPQTGDYRIDIVGHTTLKLYEGDGSGWTEVTPSPGDIVWDDSLSASPTNSTPHWILELEFVKAALGAGPEWDLRLAVFDETNSAAGVLAWPPTPQDEPQRWGEQNYEMSEWPEGFSFVVVVLLSSVAVVVGFYFLRKRPKTESYSSGKTGEINFTP
jgi:hypothetical protein